LLITDLLSYIFFSLSCFFYAGLPLHFDARAPLPLFAIEILRQLAADTMPFRRFRHAVLAFFAAAVHTMPPAAAAIIISCCYAPPRC